MDEWMVETLQLIARNYVRVPKAKQRLNRLFAMVFHFWFCYASRILTIRYDIAFFMQLIANISFEIIQG